MIKKLYSNLINSLNGLKIVFKEKYSGSADNYINHRGYIRKTYLC